MSQNKFTSAAMKVFAVALFVMMIHQSTAAPTSFGKSWEWEVTVDVFEGALQGFFTRYHQHYFAVQTCGGGVSKSAMAFKA